MTEMFAFVAGGGVGAWGVLALLAKGVLKIVPREPVTLQVPVTEQTIVLNPRQTSEGGEDMKVLSRKK